MKSIHILKRFGFVALMSVGAVAVSITPASAVKLDLAIIGANAPAWSSLGECEAERPNEGCMSMYDGCGGYDIYTTERIFDIMLNAIRNGKDIDVNIIKNGSFAGYLCKL